MGVDMLNSILSIRIYSNVRKFCCHSFLPTESMYKLHNSSMYERLNNNIDTDEATTSTTMPNVEEIMSMAIEIEDVSNNFITLYADDMYD